MRTVAYCRVSSDSQSTASQKRDLKEFSKMKGWTIAHIYEDQSTGTNVRRPAFQQLLEDARLKKFDRILVFKVDRMSRSLKDLILTLQELIDLEIEFVSLRDNIDMTTSAGRLMVNLLGSFAQFEAEIIKERTRSGLRNARANGVRLGRPPTIDKSIILSLRKKGLKMRVIAQQCNVTLSAVKSILRNRSAVKPSLLGK